MREFLKSISIYGLLPIIGKFAGFFLIPVYTRVFSSYEFGIVELLVTLASFLVFACNLEFYTAIGRFFYDNESTQERKKLISTGLFLTLFFTVIVVAIAWIAEKEILQYYFESQKYAFEYRLSLIWLLFAAVYTYLGVIPRYEKKPKLFVIISTSSLMVRVGSTLLYILVFDAGIAGVLYGHITGSIFSILFNGLISRKYLGFHFNRKHAREILRFAIPIVPSVLLIGFWEPLSRNMVTQYFSIATVGLLSFAIRITSVMEIFGGAVRLAWNPILFEQYTKPTFRRDVVRITRFTSIMVLFGGVFLTLLSPEICRYIGTHEYADSAILIGFLSFRSAFEILIKLRGFAPLLLKKTIILTLIEVVGVVLGLLLFFVLNNQWGLLGIGFAFVLPSLVKYGLIVSYTEKKYNITFHSFGELILAAMLSGAIACIAMPIDFPIRMILLAAATFVSVFIVLQLKKNSVSVE